MKTFRTLSCRVTGYRKKSNKSPCEDAVKVLKSGKYTAIAVADGHGDNRCLLANIGSELAVKSGCQVLMGYAKQYKNGSVSEYWNSEREQIGADVVKSFAELCIEDYQKRFEKLTAEQMRELLEYIDGFNNKSRQTLTPDEIRVKYTKTKELSARLEKILLLYGTTLRASLVCEGYVFSMAIGDGDTVMLTDAGVRWLIPKSPAYETGTYSMCDDFSSILSEFVFSFTELGDQRGSLSGNSYKMNLIMLCTDGLRNSFYSDDDFCRKVEDIYSSAVKKGLRPLSRSLKRLFVRLTRESFYQDDITAVIGAFFDV